MKAATFLSGIVAITGVIMVSCGKDNTPPVAGFTVTPQTGTTDSVFVFDAALSSDKEDDEATLQVRWDWTHDGIWDTDFSTYKVINHQYPEAGTFTVILEVRDSKGLSTSTSKTVEVINDHEGTIIDGRDQREYKWVKIGNQKWLAENMAYLPAVSLSGIGSDTSPLYYVYGYNGNNVTDAKSQPNYTVYGVLYNHHAAKTACPDGWHLPSDDEWKILEKSLGMSELDAGNTGFRNSGEVGRKLKSTSGWMYDGNGDNSSNFNALPAGFSDCDTGFDYLGSLTYFWSSTEVGEYDAWYRCLSYSYNSVYRDLLGLRLGTSVRCIKD